MRKFDLMRGAEEEFGMRKYSECAIRLEYDSRED